MSLFRTRSAYAEQSPRRPSLPWDSQSDRFLYQTPDALFVVNAPTRTVRQLPGGSDEYGLFPRWSADGRSIVARRNQGGVVAIEVGSGRVTALTERSLSFPTLGPKGALWGVEEIVPHRRSDSPRSLLQFLDGAWTRYDFTGEVGRPDVHPKTGTVVVGIPGTGLVIIDGRTGDRHRLTMDGTDAVPRWSPSGSQVAFVRGYRDLAVVRVTEEMR